ncbi:MAG: hypothetical protein ACPIOQ_85835 [Promethearchaeia archaeon]
MHLKGEEAVGVDASRPLGGRGRAEERGGKADAICFLVGCAHRCECPAQAITVCLVYYYLIAEFYLVDRGLRHRLPGFSSMGRLVILP